MLIDNQIVMDKKNTVEIPQNDRNYAEIPFEVYDSRAIGDQLNDLLSDDNRDSDIVKAIPDVFYSPVSIPQNQPIEDQVNNTYVQINVSFDFLSDCIQAIGSIVLQLCLMLGKAMIMFLMHIVQLALCCLSLLSDVLGQWMSTPVRDDWTFDSTPVQTRTRQSGNVSVTNNVIADNQSNVSISVNVNIEK